ENQRGQDALATGDAGGALRFYPARYAKTFQTWLENLRDWCISRQLWWGHRIPVWYKRTSRSREDDSEFPIPDSQRYEVQMIDVETARTVDADFDPANASDDQAAIAREYDIYVCCRDDRAAQEMDHRSGLVGFIQDP